MALEYIIKSGESVCIDGPAAFFTNSRFIMLSSFQENAPTIQLINGARYSAQRCEVPFSNWDLS